MKPENLLKTPPIRAAVLAISAAFATPALGEEARPQVTSSGYGAAGPAAPRRSARSPVRSAAHRGACRRRSDSRFPSSGFDPGTAALKLQYGRITLDAGSNGTSGRLQPGFQPGSRVKILSAAVDFVL